MPSAEVITESTELRALSNGFILWKDKEKRDGRSIPLETIAKESGLAKMTVRRVCGSPGVDVGTLQLTGIAKLARYFEVRLDDLVQIVSVPVSDNGKASPLRGGGS